MSRKVDNFASVITNPLPAHTFIVNIPSFDFNAVVESTSLPSDELREVVLYTQGEEIHYPTTPNNSHKWNIKVPDNADAKVYQQLMAIRNSRYNQQSGDFTMKGWFDVEIFVRDLAQKPVLSTILHGCWLKSRADVSLDQSQATNPIKWDFQFVFQWPEDKLIK